MQCRLLVCDGVLLVAALMQSSCTLLQHTEVHSAKVHEQSLMLGAISKVTIDAVKGQPYYRRSAIFSRLLTFMV